jgi:hypothetical protein
MYSKKMAELPRVNPRQFGLSFLKAPFEKLPSGISRTYRYEAPMGSTPKKARDGRWGLSHLIPHHH